MCNNEAIVDDGDEMRRREHCIQSYMDGNEKVCQILRDVEQTPNLIEKRVKLLSAGEYMERFNIKKSCDANNESKNVDNLVREVSMDTPKDTDATFVVEMNTHAREEAEIDIHYEEKDYIKGFEKNLKELDVVFSRCLNDFEVTLALYPENRKLTELKNEFGKFFKMFDESSPISKSLYGGNVRDKCRAVPVEDYSKFVPSCSLGLTQIMPKNLGMDMDIIARNGNVVIEGSGIGEDEGNCLVKGRNVVGELETLPRATVRDQLVKLRPRRGIMVAHVCRYPFVSRVIDVSAHEITNDERIVWEWLFQNKRNKKENVFKWKGKWCTKGHFQSLHDKKMVESTLIDTWSYILNVDEVLRSVSSPRRIFLTSETTYGPLQMHATCGNRIACYCAFNDHVELALQLVNEVKNKQYDVNDFDMFVFQIFHAAHHYIISYNIKEPSCEIIDNRVQTMTNEETYGDLPSLLHDCFCQFLSCYNLPKYEEIKELEPVLVSMPLKTVNNSIDCGIFVMRHMETYMGNVNLWRVGLCTEMDNQKTLLNKLRIIYSHRMLTWTENGKRNLVLDGMAKVVESKKHDG